MPSQGIAARSLRAVFYLALSPVALASETLLSEISVTAFREGGDEMRRNATTGKIVYDREVLDLMESANVADLLRKLPGGGAFADTENRRGRGKSADRNMPQILVDGQPLPGGDRNPAAVFRLPVELIERVEIIRNSTAEFPVSGPGGVINLILRDVPPKAVGSLRAATGLNSEGDPLVRLEGQFGENDGAFGYFLGGAFHSQPQTGSQTTDIQRYSGASRTDWTRELVSERGRENSLTLTPRLNWRLSNGGSFSLSPFLQMTDNNRRTLIERQAYADASAGTGLTYAGFDREREEGQRGSGRVSGEWKLPQSGGGELLVRLTVQSEFEDKDKLVRKFDANGLASSTTEEQTSRRENEWAAMLKRRQPLGESHLVTAAAEWRMKESDERQKTRANGVEAARSAGSQSDVSERRGVLWVQDEWQLDDARALTLGLRWSVASSRLVDGLGDDTDNEFRSLDPSLHYLWQVSPQWNLRSSIARNSKAPGVREMSPMVRRSSGTNSSSSPDRAGNPNLTAERDVSVELGVEHFLPERAGTFGLSLFYRRVRDQIQKLVQEESGRWIERPYNVGNAEVKGSQFDFKWRSDPSAWGTFNLRGNLTYTDTRLIDTVDGLGGGQGPRKSGNFSVDYELPSWRLTLGGNYSYIGALERESSATVSQTQGARRQLDLYALHRLDRQFGLRFSVQNATREKRTGDIQEYDAAGNLVRSEGDRETGVATFMVALEGKW